MKANRKQDAASRRKFLRDTAAVGAGAINDDPIGKCKNAVTVLVANPASDGIVSHQVNTVFILPAIGAVFKRRLIRSAVSPGYRICST